MNYSETCSKFSASTQLTCGTPILDELSIFISYIFLLREPANLLSDDYVAVLIYRTVIVIPLAISAGVCLFDIARCFAKVISDLLAILMIITEAGLELSRSKLIFAVYHFTVFLTYVFLSWQGYGQWRSRNLQSFHR